MGAPCAAEPEPKVRDAVRRIWRAGERGGIRTHKPWGVADFKSAAFTGFRHSLWAGAAGGVPAAGGGARGMPVRKGVGGVGRAGAVSCGCRVLPTGSGGSG